MVLDDVIYIMEIDCEDGDWWNCLKIMSSWQVAFLATLNLNILLVGGWEIWSSDNDLAEDLGLLGHDCVVGWAVSRISEQCSGFRTLAAAHLIWHSITFVKT